MAKRSRKRKRDQQSVKNAQERIEQARPKPTFVMEALEPRILLSATWVGTDHDGNYSGTNGADEAHGLAGHDIMHGGNGAEILHGGDGNGHLCGDNQNDTLYGGAGDDMLSQFEFDREFELPPTRASSDGTPLDAAALVEAGVTAAETFQFVDADLDRAAGLNSQAAHRRDPDASDDAGHNESVQALQHDRGHTQSAPQRGGMGAKAGQWLAGLWGMARGVGRRENEDK